MRDGRLEASGHNWVEGQGSGARIDKKDGEEEDTYDAMGNKVDTKKTKKLTSSEARKVGLSVIYTQKCVLTWRLPTAQEGADGPQKERRGGHRRRALSSQSFLVSFSFSPLPLVPYIMYPIRMPTTHLYPLVATSTYT